MSFIIAFFGIIYIVFRLVDEHAQKRSVDKRVATAAKEDADKMSGWLNRVTDPCLESEITDALYSYYHPKHAQYQQELDETIPTIPGWDRATVEDLVYDNKVRILMAKRGKLMKKDAENGIKVNTFVIKTGMSPAEHRRRNMRQKYLCQWINGQLNAHGIHYRMGFRKDCVNNVYDFEDLDMSESNTLIGYVLWEPMARTRW